MNNCTNCNANYDSTIGKDWDRFSSFLHLVISKQWAIDRTPQLTICSKERTFCKLQTQNLLVLQRGCNVRKLNYIAIRQTILHKVVVNACKITMEKVAQTAVCLSVTTYFLSVRAHLLEEFLTIWRPDALFHTNSNYKQLRTLFNLVQPWNNFSFGSIAQSWNWWTLRRTIHMIFLSI